MHRLELAQKNFSEHISNGENFCRLSCFGKKRSSSVRNVLAQNLFDPTPAWIIQFKVMGKGYQSYVHVLLHKSGIFNEIHSTSNDCTKRFRHFCIFSIHRIEQIPHIFDWGLYMLDISHVYIYIYGVHAHYNYVICLV